MISYVLGGILTCIPPWAYITLIIKNKENLKIHYKYKGKIVLKIFYNFSLLCPWWYVTNILTRGKLMSLALLLSTEKGPDKSTV